MYLLIPALPILGWWHKQNKVQKATLKLFILILGALAVQLWPPLPPPLYIVMVMAIAITTLALYLVSHKWPTVVAVLICLMPILAINYNYYIYTLSDKRNAAWLMVILVVLAIKSSGSLITHKATLPFTAGSIIFMTLSKIIAGEFSNLSNIVLDHHLDIILIGTFTYIFIQGYKQLEEEKKLHQETKARIQAEKANKKALNLLHSNRVTLEKGTITSDLTSKKEGFKLTLKVLDPDTNEKSWVPIEIPYSHFKNGTKNLDLSIDSKVELTGRLTSTWNKRFKNQVYIKVMKIKNL